MFIEFYGAAGEVTGSMHRVHVGGVDVLLDCGMFQGHRAQANRLNHELPSWALGAQALLLSHAHLDHSGNLPTLVKRGFEGNIYCSPPTRDLCSVMLRDAAMIQAQDARWLNKQAKKRGERGQIEPLYTADDVQRAMGQMISVPLHRPMPIAKGITATFHNSGHVLGSTLIQLDLSEHGRTQRVLFTGDLGRKELPLLRTPEIVKDVNLLLMESTYGDRTHPPIESIDDELARIVNDTIARGGRVYIPTFALERAQEVLFAFERLHERGVVPEVPMYIDSPLAIAITEIYKLHPEGLSDQVRKRIMARNDPFSPPGMRYVSDVQDSIALQQSGEPCVVIAGAGMCEGGRILHHFAKGLEDDRNSVVIIGFMAQHTLGRRLVERRKRVKVFGVERDVYAKVHVLNGLSAHADRDNLVEFARETAAQGRVETMVLVHGEPPAQRALKELLDPLGAAKVVIPERGETLKL